VGDAEILILPDEAAVSRAAAERTVAALRTALEARGTAHLALTGGSSAVPLYRDLANPPWQAAIDWRSVHMWWGDDRFVPRDHPESNAGMAYRVLFALGAFSGESGTGFVGVDVEAGIAPGLWIDPDKVHPILTEEAIANGLGPSWAAQRYVDEIGRWLPATPSTSLPMFDVILLGVGPDGHALSAFPGSRALDPDAPIVLDLPAPDHVEPYLPRVTLSTRVLAAAGMVILMATGEGKAEILARVLGAEHNAARWPAQAALLPNAVWFLDEAAAANLDG
jgi:6-phosphogluconolactonase